MLTRVGRARDFSSGLELSNALLGRNSSLEVHHIFPKNLLYKAGRSKSIVNTIANYAFITKDTNLEISNRYPEECIPEYIRKTPGAIESHWIPTEPALWKLDRCEDFLSQRRVLLAAGANAFLDSLYGGQISSVAIEGYSSRDLGDISDSEEAAIAEVIAWMTEHELDPGIANYNLVDLQGNTLAIIDLAWPDGIQTGLSSPVALLLNEPEDVHQIVNHSGYRYFTDTESFLMYVRQNITI